MQKTSSMAVSSKSTCRAGFKCPCCQTEPGQSRKVERRAIKRRSNQDFRRDVRNDNY